MVRQPSRWQLPPHGDDFVDGRNIPGAVIGGVVVDGRGTRRDGVRC